jgi:hypothetical protein
VIPEQAQLLLSNLDRAATKLGNQHLVADRHAGSDPLSILVEGTGANGYNLGLVELLDGGLGQEDTGCGLGFRLDALNEDAVEERSDGAD